MGPRLTYDFYISERDGPCFWKTSYLGDHSKGIKFHLLFYSEACQTKNNCFAY